jgi:hypothetical protein
VPHTVGGVHKTRAKGIAGLAEGCAFGEVAGSIVHDKDTENFRRTSRAKVGFLSRVGTTNQSQNARRRPHDTARSIDEH